MTEKGKSKKQSSREAILASGALCFMERGFSATSIDDIAERIGATKGMVYHYFDSKAELFFEIQQKGMDALFAEINPLLSAELAPQERFIAMAHAHVRTLLDTQPFQRTMSEGVYMHLRHSSNQAQAKQLQALQARRHEYEDVFLSALTQGVEAGELRADNPRLATRLILASLNSIIVWYQVRENDSNAEREQFISSVVDTVLKGVIHA